MNSQIVTVNLTPGLSAPAVVRVSQGDIGRPLTFRIMDGTSPAILESGTTATIEGTKPSGLGFSEEGTRSGSAVIINTTLAMTQESGLIPCEIRFAQGNNDIGTANFILAVERTPHADGTTDGTQETMANLETRLQSEINDLSDRIDDIEAGGSGLSQTEKNLILTLFSKAAYADSDAGTAYDTLENLWTTTTRTITYNLSYVSSSNSASTIEDGSSYSTTLTATSGRTINTIRVTMGGVDITSTAYSSGTISIPSVTGNIVITATAVTSVASISAVYTQSGTVYDTYVLDSLKSGLVVTATYSDSTTETIPSTDYTLSGTLEEGTSVIVVTYAGKTTTFTVTVSVRIPSAYKQIEYLESDGTQGITTNVIPRDTMTEVTFEYVGFADGRDNFITGVFNANNQRYYACWLDSTGKFVFQNRNNSGVWTDGPVKPTGKHTVIYNNASHQALYDGVVRGTDALLAITSGDNKLAIFCRGRDTTDTYLTTSSISRIYSLKFTDNSTSNAVAEFIPCYRKTDGVGGMYDLVSQTFYTDSINGNAFSFGSGAWETGA